MICICSDTEPCERHAFRAAKMMKLPPDPMSVKLIHEVWPEVRVAFGSFIYGGLA